MTPYIDKYTHSHLGELVIMLSLDGVQPLLPHVGLTLSEPSALQDLCSALSFQVDEALYDEDAMGWNRRFFELSELLKQTGVAALPTEDQSRFLFWLENGTVPTMHSFPHRNFWHDALASIVRNPDMLGGVDDASVPQIMTLAQTVSDRLRDPAYEAAKERFAEEPESFFDTFQKTKFHINVVPDAIVSQHLIGLNWMRRIHVVRVECEGFVAQGNDIGCVEDIVQHYAQTEVTSAWLSDYVADRPAFQFSTLWSNRFRGGIQ